MFNSNSLKLFRSKDRTFYLIDLFILQNSKFKNSDKECQENWSLRKQLQIILKIANLNVQYTLFSRHSALGPNSRNNAKLNVHVCNLWALYSLYLSMMQSTEFKIQGGSLINIQQAERYKPQLPLTGYTYLSKSFWCHYHSSKKE